MSLDRRLLNGNADTIGTHVLATTQRRCASTTDSSSSNTVGDDYQRGEFGDDDDEVVTTMVRRVDKSGFYTILTRRPPLQGFRPCAVLDHIYNLVILNQRERLSAAVSSQGAKTKQLSEGVSTSPPVPNILVTGPDGTGKVTLLLQLAEDMKKNHLAYHTSVGGSAMVKPLIVCVTTMDSRKAYSLDGLTTNIFLGIKLGTEPTSYEQAFNTMERHILLMADAFGHAFCTIKNTDVLIIDSLELMPAHTLEALDDCARKHRNQPDLPFGGLQVLCSANFWKMPKVHPTSPLDNYVFQSEAMDRLFPLQSNERSVRLTKNQTFEDNGSRRFVLQRVWKHETFGLRGAQYSHFAIKALYGRLNDQDAVEFEKLCELDTNLLSEFPATELSDNLLGRQRYSSRFAKYFAEFTLPQKSGALRKTQFGAYMNSLWSTIGNAGGWGLSEKLDFIAGESIVALTHDLLDERGQVDIPCGTSGRAVSAGEHGITVHFEGRRVRKISRMSCELYHPHQPMMKSVCCMFPLLQVNRLYPIKLLEAPCTPVNLIVDGFYVTETNEMANLMIKMRGPVGVSFKNLNKYFKREGMIHEPAKFFYEELMRYQALQTTYGQRTYPASEASQSTSKQPKTKASVISRTDPAEKMKSVSPFCRQQATAPPSKKRRSSTSTSLEDEIDDNAEVHRLLSTHAVYSALFPPSDRQRWCRNCKNLFDITEFFDHWKECIKKQRWCVDCSVTVPTAKWEAHQEKHTVVICIDCVRSLEWRHWESHRMTCGAMLREVSHDNEMLPQSTQREVLQAGFDRRDMHSVKQMSRAALPKGDEFQGVSTKARNPSKDSTKRSLKPRSLVLS